MKVSNVETSGDCGTCLGRILAMNCWSRICFSPHIAKFKRWLKKIEEEGESYGDGRKRGHFSSMIHLFRKNGASNFIVFFFLLLFMVVFIFTHWIDMSVVTGTSFKKGILKPQKYQQLRVNCSFTCPPHDNDQAAPQKFNASSLETCPEYFRWIHEDLKPWKETGITREMVERGKQAAHIRIVVIKGRMYVEKYRWVYQTRDVFTVWGILQLLRMYPGRIPDFDLMFECGDVPVIKKRDHIGRHQPHPPPIFHYCGDDRTFDIVFPDWSFWGWPEIHVEPWTTLKKQLEQGTHRIKWVDRKPHAYWKGHAGIGPARKDLVRCNVTDQQDWNARIYGLDWQKETNNGFKNTDLANQCDYRYKIYVEGFAWSVSEKYILACDSVSMLIDPQYYDFFTRELLPTIHYWPIDMGNKCSSIKFAVDWGNSHPQEAQKLAKRASKFIQEELKMKHVYDYMFHLLSEYAKLFKYEPTVPEGAIEVCAETLACSGSGLHEVYKAASMVWNPSDTAPCNLPPPYDPPALQGFLDRKANLRKQVQKWEASGNANQPKSLTSAS